VRDDSRNYLVVGAFTLAMLAAFVAWMAALSGHTGAVDRYEVAFENVTGLGPGTEVWFEGFPIGRIEDIAPLEAPERGFRVELGVELGWRIPEDSVAHIAAPGFLAAVVIDIASGSSEKPLAPGSRMQSQEAANLFAAISSVAGEIGNLAEEELRPLFDELARGAPDIVRNLGDFSVRINDTAERLNRLLGSENSARIDRILENLEATSSHTSALSADLEQTQQRIEGLMSSMERMISSNEQNIDHAIQDLQVSLEAVAQHASSIANHLDATMRNLNEFSGEIRENPGVILRGRSLDEEPGEGGGP
jgi:phospholipid/cholesterol/gamma-HCH transport system substrate-binding protein